MDTEQIYIDAWGETVIFKGLPITSDAYLKKEDDPIKK